MARQTVYTWKALLDVIDFVAGGTKAQPNAVFAGSVPYLMLAGNVVAGWQLARSLLWNDPSVGVAWPLHLLDGTPLLSAKDVAGKVLAECEVFA